MQFGTETIHNGVQVQLYLEMNEISVSIQTKLHIQIRETLRFVS